MNTLHATAFALKQEASNRPAGYLDEIAPAIVSVGPRGGVTYNIDHPAWIEAAQ